MYISGSKQLPVASLDPGACDAFMMNVLIEFDMCCHVCFSLFYLLSKANKKCVRNLNLSKVSSNHFVSYRFLFHCGTLFNEGNEK